MSGRSAKKPDILILDDAISAVDLATERRIHNALASVEQNSQPTTKIIIAQRISSVMGADEILVLDDGKISGIGTHEKLLRKNPIYLEIYRSQIDTDTFFTNEGPQ